MSFHERASGNPEPNSFENRLTVFFDSFSRLVLPGVQTPVAIDEFTYQQLSVGLRTLDIGISGEVERDQEENKTTYFFGPDYPIRKRNFYMLRQLGREIINTDLKPISSHMIRNSDEFKVKIELIEQDFSKVYEWMEKLVVGLEKAHPDSVFIKGLRQAIIDYIPEDEDQSPKE